MNIYLNLRSSSNEDEAETTEEQQQIIQTLRNIKKLKEIGLEQMSLWKWAQVLRETTGVLQDYAKQSSIPELQSLFQPVSKNTLWADINKLISIRNADAHGNPIAPDKLNAELTSRQEILDRVLEQCGFIGEYNVAIFEKLVLDADQQRIAGKTFVNDGEESILVNTELEPPMDEVVLVDKKESFYLRLRPLMVYASAKEEDSNQLSIFSKQLSRDGDKVHFLGVDGPVDLIISEFDTKTGQNFAEQWKYLNEVYSEWVGHTPVPPVRATYGASLPAGAKVESVVQAINDNCC